MQTNGRTDSMLQVETQRHIEQLNLCTLDQWLKMQRACAESGGERRSNLSHHPMCGFWLSALRNQGLQFYSLRNHKRNRMLYVDCYIISCLRYPADSPSSFGLSGSNLQVPRRSRPDLKRKAEGPKGIWEFPKIRGALFWVLMIRILLFRVLY